MYPVHLYQWFWLAKEIKCYRMHNSLHLYCYKLLFRSKMVYSVHLLSYLTNCCTYKIISLLKRPNSVIEIREILPDIVIDSRKICLVNLKSNLTLYRYAGIFWPQVIFRLPFCNKFCPVVDLPRHNYIYLKNLWTCSLKLLGRLK